MRCNCNRNNSVVKTLVFGSPQRKTKVFTTVEVINRNLDAKEHLDGYNYTE